MKRILCAAVIAAFAATPAPAVVLHTYSCVVSEEFGGDTIWLIFAGANHVGAYSRYSEPNAEPPDDARSVEVVTMNDVSAVYDTETKELLMLNYDGEALIQDKSGTWAEADCSPGGMPASVLRDLGIEEE